MQKQKHRAVKAQKIILKPTKDRADEKLES